jgi:hypothetical protein
MKASEIVDKLKSVLLSAEEPQAEPAVEQEEQVELSVEEVEVQEEVVLAEGEDMPSEEEAPVEEKDDEYVSKQEFESAIAEMKAMYAAIVEKMGSEEEQMEVPEELAKEEQVDLSADEPAAEPIAHAPEVEESAKMNFFKQNKPRNTMSVVYEKMFNK